MLNGKSKSIYVEPVELGVPAAAPAEPEPAVEAEPVAELEEVA